MKGLKILSKPRSNAKRYAATWLELEGRLGIHSASAGRTAELGFWHSLKVP
jgi:hypothetical protein